MRWIYVLLLIYAFASCETPIDCQDDLAQDIQIAFFMLQGEARVPQRVSYDSIVIANKEALPRRIIPPQDTSILSVPLYLTENYTALHFYKDNQYKAIEVTHHHEFTFAEEDCEPKVEVMLKKVNYHTFEEVRSKVPNVLRKDSVYVEIRL